MEPFVDGGLIELAIAFAISCSLNFIFKRKYLLMLYSLSAVAAPVVLLFIRSGEPFVWAASICIFNGIFLVVLLWKQWVSSPDKNLFDTRKLQEKYFSRKPKAAGHSTAPGPSHGLGETIGNP